MPLIAAYFRPDRLDDALELLAEPGHQRIPLAGGTVVNADRARSEIEVVDLQALGLTAIEADGDRVRIGATTTLAEVAASDAVPDELRLLANREEPSTLRTLATVGGAVAVGHAESLLLAALLAHETTVQLVSGNGDGAETAAPLAEVLAGGIEPRTLVTAIELDRTGTTGHALTARTPADIPIVGAVARRTDATTTMALCGVADTPVLADPDDPTAGLDPPGDFRGSSAYRRTVAGVLARRALAAAGADR